MIDRCQLACLIAVGMFSGQLYVMLNSNKKVLFERFDSLLDKEQKGIYKKIINQRMNLYIQGMVLGLVLGFVYLCMVPSKTMGRSCLFTIIVLGTNYFYYMLMPKSNYMVPHLTTVEQRVAWLDIYKEMQSRCKIGFLLGLVSYLILGYFVKM